MASSSSLALRRLLSSTIVPRSLRIVHPAAASRLFNTNAVRNYEDIDDRNHCSNQPVTRGGGDFSSEERSRQKPKQTYLSVSLSSSLFLSLSVSAMTSSSSPSRKALSKIACNRLQKELSEWQVNPPTGFKHKITDNLQKWVIEVRGAPGTLYANETYNLQDEFPQHYLRWILLMEQRSIRLDFTKKENLHCTIGA